MSINYDFQLEHIKKYLLTKKSTLVDETIQVVSEMNAISLSEQTDGGGGPPRQWVATSNFESRHNERRRKRKSLCI